MEASLVHGWHWGTNQSYMVVANHLAKLGRLVPVHFHSVMEYNYIKIHNLLKLESVFIIIFYNNIQNELLY